MRSLYEIKEDYKTFQAQLDAYTDMVEAGEIPEESIWDTLEAIEGEFTEKIDSIACIYNQIRYEAAMIDAEIKKLGRRLAAKKKSAERLSNYLSTSMLDAWIGNLETARVKITFRKSEKVMIDDEDLFVQWAQEYNPDLLTYKTPEPNKTVIKSILKSGQAIEGCRMENCLNMQVK